jgi:cbb3-type cytochrome oxidase maturation protein
MIDFFFLVPIAIAMGLAGLASFMWTLKSGQYDDLEGAAERILFQANEGPDPPSSCEVQKISRQKRDDRSGAGRHLSSGQREQPEVFPLL